MTKRRFKQVNENTKLSFNRTESTNQQFTANYANKYLYIPAGETAITCLPWGRRTSFVFRRVDLFLRSFDESAQQTQVDKLATMRWHCRRDSINNRRTKAGTSAGHVPVLHTELQNYIKHTCWLMRSKSDCPMAGSVTIFCRSWMTFFNAAISFGWTSATMYLFVFDSSSRFCTMPETEDR